MIKNDYKPFVLTIEAHGKKFSGESHWDCSTNDVMGVMKGLMIAAGFAEAWLESYCEDWAEENGYVKQ